MKKTKKLLALALALMLSLSCMAMPAMAHGDGDEGIMPLGMQAFCARCNAMRGVVYRDSEYVRTKTSVVCSKNPHHHTHDVYRDIVLYDCGHTDYGPIMIIVRTNCYHK